MGINVFLLGPDLGYGVGQLWVPQSTSVLMQCTNLFGARGRSHALPAAPSSTQRKQRDKVWVRFQTTLPYLSSISKQVFAGAWGQSGGGSTHASVHTRHREQGLHQNPLGPAQTQPRSPYPLLEEERKCPARASGP